MKRGWDQADPRWGRGFPGTWYLQGTLPRTPGKVPGRAARTPGAPAPGSQGRLSRPSRAAPGWGGRARGRANGGEGLGSTGGPGGPGSGLSWRARAEARGGGGAGAGPCHWLEIIGGGAGGGAAGGRRAQSLGRQGQGPRLRTAQRGAGQGTERRRDLGPQPSCTAWRRGFAEGRGGGGEEGIRFLGEL